MLLFWVAFHYKLCCYLAKVYLFYLKLRFHWLSISDNKIHNFPFCYIFASCYLTICNFKTEIDIKQCDKDCIKPVNVIYQFWISCWEQVSKKIKGSHTWITKKKEKLFWSQIQAVTVFIFAYNIFLRLSRKKNHNRK